MMPKMDDFEVVVKINNISDWVQILVFMISAKVLNKKEREMLEQKIEIIKKLLS